MSQYFPKPFNSDFGDSIKVKIDLSNYTTKTDIKNISHVDISSFALKANLAGLKTEVDKLGIDKLVPISVDLSKLSDVVKNDVLILVVLLKKTNYNTKITELENEILDISNLATKTAWTARKSKIPGVSNLVKKTDYNTKITEIENKLNNHNHNKYIDTSEFNKLAADAFNARLA